MIRNNAPKREGGKMRIRAFPVSYKKKNDEIRDKILAF